MPRVYGEPRNMITLYYFVIGGSIFFFSFLFSFPRIIQAFEMIIARIYRFFTLHTFAQDRYFSDRLGRMHGSVRLKCRKIYFSRRNEILRYLLCRKIVEKTCIRANVYSFFRLRMYRITYN